MRGYKLDIKNPSTAAENLDDPEELLGSLNSTEVETARSLAR